MNVTKKILLALIAGSIIGVILNLLEFSSYSYYFYVDSFLLTIGNLFISSLKMLVVPVVFTSLVCGVSGLGEISNLGRIGIKSIIFYIFTTCIAVTLALIVAYIVQPGLNAGLITTSEINISKAPSISEVLVNIIPSNPIKAMSDGNMLQIIFFSMIFGISIALLGKKAENINNGMIALNNIILKMVELVMYFAPYGVFCLLTRTFYSQGIDTIINLGSYFITVIFVLFLHLILTYSSLLLFIGRLSPFKFFKKIRTTMIFAFSTASSAATIPVTLKSVEEKLGVDKSVTSFTVPLGATINMDGTAIMQGVATIFIANAYGISLSMSDFLSVIIVATLASIGTAGVPGVGLIMLTMVLNQVGLPVEGIAMIIGIDRLLDMIRTAVNVAGDATISCIIGKSEKKFSLSLFNK